MTLENQLDYIHDEIVQRGIATEEEVKLVTCINGYSKQTLDDIVWVRTGYQSINQLFVMELEEA